MNTQEYLDKKNELAKAGEEILTRAKSENRYLTPDENAKFDALHTEIEQISNLIEREQKIAALGQTEGRKADPNPIATRTTTAFAGPADRYEGLKVWMRAGAMGYEVTPEDRATASRCGIDLGSKSYTLKLLSPVALRGLDADSQRTWKEETRAAFTGAQSTTTTGGYTVADAAMQSLEVALLRFGAMRQVASIYRTATGGPLPFPTTNDTSQKGRLLSENTAATETEMTFGQLVLDAYKYSSDYVLASVEFINDTSINFPAFIGDALGTRIGRLQNDHFTTGTGSSQPNGIVTAASSGVTSVADPPTYDNIVDLVHAVDPAYRDNSRFMMNDATLKTLKKIKVLQYSGDTTGYPLWSPGLAPGQPNTILGFPYVINQSMASPGSSAKKVLFGDFSKYVIRDVTDVTLLRLDERFAELHQVAFLAFARSDGDLLNAGTNPVKYMQQA